jgi:hypothetical protein
LVGMTETALNEHEQRAGRSRRSIGPWGTAARVVVGALLVGSVAEGHLSGDFHPWPWILGLVGFPLVVLAWQRWRASRHPSRLAATGPAAQLINIAAFAVLYLTPVTSDAALLFYGTSMLLAAARGYAGCEVLAVSNWLLRRDDQIGCMVFGPVDTAEHARRHAVPDGSTAG